MTASRAWIAEAGKRKAFVRAFRKEVVAPADLADQVGRLLRRTRCRRSRSPTRRAP